MGCDLILSVMAAFTSFKASDFNIKISYMTEEYVGLFIHQV